MLFLAQQQGSGSQQGYGGRGQPQSGVSLIAGLDTGILGLHRLSGLVVGIGLAAHGALAVLVVVTGGGDGLTLLDDLVADGADLVAGIAIFGAGGGLSAHLLGLVAGGGDGLALLDDLVANGADFVAGVAVLGAGSGLRAYQLGLVAGSGDNLALLDGLTADGADLVAGIAIFRAGGGLRAYQFGLVAQSGDGQGLQGGLVHRQTACRTRSTPSGP